MTVSSGGVGKEPSEYNYNQVRIQSSTSESACIEPVELGAQSQHFNVGKKWEESKS